MKKFLAIFLTLTMLLTMSVMPAFAEGETGSITINGVSETTTYEIYQLLDLESYDTTAGAYSYTQNAEWEEFFATAEAKAYISFETKETPGYASWVAGDDAEITAEFAKLALAYAKANDIKPVKSSKNTGEFVITGTTGVFSGLRLGYYLVDSTMGALCGLTTTNPNASINAKNGIPTIDKQVHEDSIENHWGASNTADIGQTVEYMVTINVHAGAENYVLHDKMAAGLTFNDAANNITNTVTKIEHVVPGTGTHTVDTKKYTVKTGTDVITDGCTFEVHFTKEFCDELETNDKIIVYYTAMLNRNAVIAGEGNKNTAWLSFGEGGESNEDTVTTYTYGIDIVKTDSQNTLIDGAEFKIYDAAENGNEVGVVFMDDGVTYRRARADEMAAGKSVPIVVKNGQIRVVGLDNGTYYLEETVAPDGYNKLTARQKFIISDGNLDAVFNDGVFSTGSGVHVVNKTGSMLPETGGFGTTMFILLGGLAVMAAGIFLFVNKRMSQIKE